MDITLIEFTTHSEGTTSTQASQSKLSTAAPSPVARFSASVATLRLSGTFIIMLRLRGNVQTNIWLTITVSMNCDSSTLIQLILELLLVDILTSVHHSSGALSCTYLRTAGVSFLMKSREDIVWHTLAQD